MRLTYHLMFKTVRHPIYHEGRYKILTVIFALRKFSAILCLIQPTITERWQITTQRSRPIKVDDVSSETLVVN